MVSFYGDDFTEFDLTTQLEILSTRFAKEFQSDKPYTLRMILSFLHDLSAGQRVSSLSKCARLLA